MMKFQGKARLVEGVKLRSEEISKPKEDSGRFNMEKLILI